MKKLCVLFLAVMFYLSAIAMDTKPVSVVTSEGKIDCKKISLGINKARIVLENGETRSIPITSISSYTIDQKVFTRLPLYQNGNPTGHQVFMELIKSSGELSLYKVGLWETGQYILDDKSDFYFLYKGDKLHLALDNKTLPNICRYFGLQYSYK